MAQRTKLDPNDRHTRRIVENHNPTKGAHELFKCHDGPVYRDAIGRIGNGGGYEWTVFRCAEVACFAVRKEVGCHRSPPPVTGERLAQRRTLALGLSDSQRRLPLRFVPLHLSHGGHGLDGADLHVPTLAQNPVVLSTALKDGQ